MLKRKAIQNMLGLNSSTVAAKTPTPIPTMTPQPTYENPRDWAKEFSLAERVSVDVCVAASRPLSCETVTQFLLNLQALHDLWRQKVSMVSVLLLSTDACTYHMRGNGFLSFSFNQISNALTQWFPTRGRPTYTLGGTCQGVHGKIAFIIWKKLKLWFDWKNIYPHFNMN